VQGVGQAAGQAAQAVAPQISGALDPARLTERLEQVVRGEGPPEAMTSEQRLAEITRLIGERVRQTGGTDTGGERLAQLVAAEFDIPPDQAQARIQQIEARAREAATEMERQARIAAEAASNAAATGAYWVFAAMILGAAAAVIGGRIGTRRLVTRTV
jgi:hypothetical protein